MILKINQNIENIDEYFEQFHLSSNRKKLLDLKEEDDGTIISYKSFNDVIPYDEKIDIVFEDEHILAINKKRGVLIHPSTIEEQNTLVNMVKAYYVKTKQDVDILYIGRLDLNTTGLVIFAKDILTHAYLSYLVENNELHREYLAIAKNRFKEMEGVIDKPIGRDRHNAKKMRISKTGKTSITKYAVIKKIDNNISLLKLNLVTGRTHQIRLHLSSINHPLLGDDLYDQNDDKKHQLMLHSSNIRFVLPFTDKKYYIEAPLPLEFKKIARF